MVAVSILIVNYNTTKLLCQAIQSVFEKTNGLVYEIIVADNNSTECPKNELEQLFGQKIKYIQLPDNIGFGAANNAAAKIAQGKYLFLLNPDTVLINNAVKVLLDTLDSDRKIGIVGGNLFNNKHQPTHSFTRLFPGICSSLNAILWNIPARIFYGRNSEFNFSDKNINVAYVTGADLMIRKDIFETLQGFDSKYFIYFEETDLCYRASKKGWKIISNPHSKVVHLEGQSFQVKEKRETIYNSSMQTFLSTRYNNFNRMIANQLYSLSLLSLSLFYKLRKAHDLSDTLKQKRKLFLNFIKNDR